MPSQSSLWLVLIILMWLMPIYAHGMERTALVIGNGAYAYDPLANPPNDAKDMARVLGELGFEVTLRLNVDHRGFEDAVREFRRAVQRRGGVAMFYYAGHGVQVQGHNYLVPVDSEIESVVDLKYHAVNTNYVLDNMLDADASLTVVILDACRDNPFHRLSRSIRSGLAPVQAPVQGELGTLIAYSTAPGGVASDAIEGGRNSPYASHLLSAMQTPGLKLEEVFKKVRIRVHRETRGKQTPWVSNGTLGDFYFQAADTGALQAKVQVPSPLIPETPTYKPQLETPSASTRRTVTKYALTVVPTPSDARIKLANVDAKYYPGIRLKPGKYKIQVSREGYEVRSKWVELNSDDQVINVALAERARPRTSEPTASKSWTEPLTGMEFIWMSGGCFAMGSPPGETGRDSKNEQQRQVCVEGYWIGKYEVTLAQYRKYRKHHNIDPYREEDEDFPDRADDSNLPVTISWRQAAEFAKWLSKKSRKQFRLPSEKEWEYAARGGLEGAHFWGEDPDQTCQYANVADARALNNPLLGLSRVFAQSLDAPYMCDDGYNFLAPVGSFRPNAYGLYDMLGNVAEWTTAEYRQGAAPDERACASASSAWIDTDALPTEVECVIRGGSWLSGQKDTRLAGRGSAHKERIKRHIGFRLIMSEQ